MADNPGGEQKFGGCALVGFLEANGTRFRVEEAGSGPDLLLMHAGVADRRMWNPQWDWLSRHFHVVRYDHRGLGESALVPGPFSYFDDTVAVVEGLGLTDITVVGSSFGGALAVHLAATRPELVNRLVLVAAGLAGYDPGIPRPEIFAEAERAWKAKDWERVIELDQEAWIVGLGRRREDLDPNFLAFALEMDRTSLRWLDVENESQDNSDDTGALSGISAPALVIVGTDDIPESVAIAEHLAKALPHARLEKIEGTSHLPNLERPAAFNAVLGPFLGIPAPRN